MALSLVAKHLALHHGMNHSADPISIASCLLENLVSLFTIRKFHFRPGRIGDQLIEEMTSKLIFL